MKPTKRPILLIDDDKDICELLQLVLESEGYRTAVANDGATAWRQLNDGLQPALIILDWMMPRMDGEQFLNKLSASRLAKVPVIVMSGNDAIHGKAATLTRGCCLKKPVELDDLLSTVKRVIAASPTQDAA